MLSKKLSIVLVAVLTAGILVNSSTFAAAKKVKDISGTEDFKDLNIVVDGKKLDSKKTEAPKKVRKKVKQIGATVISNPDSCAFNYPDTESYGADVVSIRRQLKVNPGESFRVKVFLRNTSNMPWFSNKSDCHGLKMSLGTDKERDHDSIFYNQGLAGWEGSNRIGMDQLRVDPGQIASFTFTAQAATNGDVYKEYFAPVLKDVQWLDSSRFYLDVMVGDTDESAGDLRKKIAYSTTSGSVMNIDLNAQKSVHVDLAEQTLHAYLGDSEVQSFRVSTGKSSTPTPKGSFKIFLKQNVRVGSEPPHYVMPKFQMFIDNGTGFHALPSLAGDGGTFWTEARNHIGIPVSHGCVRLLPEDADWLFDFSDTETKVNIS
ncbi:L,D-transpeptidase [Candidatus Peregrinibacteria bacterium]|nr:L,D-transpeptidase [Candidatus Peregrinibacteria bacterium]